MLVPFVDKPLVNLIAEAQSVVFDTQVSNHLQLVSGENLEEGDRRYLITLFCILSSEEAMRQLAFVLSLASST